MAKKDSKRSFDDHTNVHCKATYTKLKATDNIGLYMTIGKRRLFK